jgi:hypothetical protein
VTLGWKKNHRIGDLVVAGLNEPVSKTSTVIGMVYEISPAEVTGGDDDLLFVMWSNGTMRRQWGYQVMPLEK